MTWEKGQTGNPQGRPKGSHNNLTQSIKNAIIKAYYKMGGDRAFINWCIKNPDIFYRDGWMKMLPKDVVIEGDIDHTLTVKIVKFGGDAVTIGDSTSCRQLETENLPAPPLDIS